MTTWRAEDSGDKVRIGPAGWILALTRGAALGTVTYGGLLVLLAVRLVERPLAGLDRPVSPHVTRAVCRLAFPIMGMRYRVTGRPMRQPGAVVANHASWLDIFSLNACQSVYFVSKSEVAGWPLIGWLARATGTAFIARDPKAAKEQQALFEARIRAGHKLLFFPEGTSTDGLRVLPFKSTLFAAFYSHGLDHEMQIQPVSVIYRAPEGRSERFYGWWGDMSFGAHLIKTLAQWRQGSVEITFHAPVSVDAFASRKDLARYCEDAVRGTVRQTLGEGYQG
ncbi:lysophospholipid acyltransferase family protein [Defluviimonas sp. SAOS-178_SWC]|uniref:lysophospholipid acyltransferase family protein n=1 Tax=Defluviimonas sp. SAOS-178_SWC TaxID=3121287 RepID=UPI003221DCBE